MQLIKYLFITLTLSIVLFVAYEGAMVFKAVQKTKDIKRHYLNSTLITLKFQDLPAEWINMLLIVEDPGFFEHQGVDLETPGQGYTTISQAICKSMYFDNFEPGFAKIEQSLITYFVLDKNFSKEEQLNIFLNTAYLGHVNGKPVYGFEHAANAYFDSSFAELSEQQYLSLVAMLVAPNGFNIKTNPEQNEQRVKRIERLLSGEYVPQSLTDIYYQQET
ncbi:biosynthetic peptidoglycan transglycosylase [Thalassotalea sp. PS06]|uniref:biosynthetic peptidoglycan transglycosylase n=1 Tax=Thalassotalea sp. PS06 TaxID=2594005 RepID=UPI00116438A7|nr:biosynthetic peptidoglycan transglycosylase [Thalassotalea sp. PS06]QDP01302.1 glycosyl transferase family 51 [Thalassotalea sp. PS06]